MKILAGLIFCIALYAGIYWHVHESLYINSEMSPVTASFASCPYEALLSDANGLIDQLEYDVAVWRIASTTLMSHPDRFAWVQATEDVFAPCAYQITFQQNTEIEQSFKLEQKLNTVLQRNGWSTDAFLELSLGKDENPSTVMFAHADGFMSSEVIFYRINSEDEDSETMQFIRVGRQDYRERLQDFRNGTSDSPCPCTEEISLTISEPFLLRELRN